MTEIHFGDRLGREGRIRVGCAALLFDSARKKILLTRRTDTGDWCLPSGGVEPGESVSETCERETLEETGLRVRVLRLVGINSSPDRLVIYSDGGKYQIISLGFEVEWIGGAARLSDETSEIGFFSIDELDRMDVFPHHKQFIQDALHGQQGAVLR
jgi:8-oxo-dGTP pyrophosphatase MutT (NUDIX family)